jgi:hypothetical protein
MRKWRNLTPQDDPQAWREVGGMWPTALGSYEVADFYDGGTNKTATGAASVISAWAFKTLSGQRCYVVAGSSGGGKVFEYSAGSFTDRSAAVGSIGSGGHMCQYGDVSILTRGTAASLAYSTGGNFAALAGSPSAQIVCVQSNAVVAFNNSSFSDGWSASDVGDYTNWTTGEAASGRILENNGPITAAVPFGNDIIVFKSDSIFRMTYVGGTLKWQVQKIWQGVGCMNPSGQARCLASECAGKIVFTGQSRLGTVDPAPAIYVFDGASPPAQINLDLQLQVSSAKPLGEPYPIYDARSRRVYLITSAGTPASVCPYYYSQDSDAWGLGVDIFSSTGANSPCAVRGDSAAVETIFGNAAASPCRPLFVFASTNNVTLYMPVQPGGATASSGYVKTGKVGRVDAKTLFSRLTPLLRRRVNGSGTPLCSLTVEFYRELHDTTASSTLNVTESSLRKRFDFTGSDNFAMFKVTFADMDAEVDEVLVLMKSAGAE